ncbi:hypothetical protein CCAX7_001620 [Capsulimonas corticalis]|uniref:Uncharacterized protein n=1 Tax=Capsulimonas corticalis TaxID=2219043 RepID=A0A402CRS6_9BACT|nr:hypothetical protein [Capsulimonas corticalis]BDI28111.1 hypothetical protein CCAX7_001620 [Capsulimonas corticalis]
MKLVKLIAAPRRAFFAGAAVIAFLLPAVAGCNDDQPIDYQQARTENGYPTDVTTPPTVAQDMDTSPDTKSSTPLADEKDPLVAASGLDMATPDKSSTVMPPDPLLPPGNEDGTKLMDGAKPLENVKPLEDNSPAAGKGLSSVNENNPYWLKGHVTTDHSHWLRGSVTNAHLRIRVNNVQVEDLRGPVDDDISQYCRKGFNTVTFLYEPNGAGASAVVNLLESEHTPPIPPLVTFDSRNSPYSAAGDKYSSGPVPQTFNFSAK